MSFREKTAWISLLSTSAIYGLYFWHVFNTHPFSDQDRFGGLLGAVIALVFVQTVLTIVVAILAPKEAQAKRDEREKLIDLKSTRLAYLILAGCVACACFFAGFNPPIVFNPNNLLFILVMAELFRSGCQVVQYRQGV